MLQDQYENALAHIQGLGANEIKIRLYWNKFLKQIDVYDFTKENNIAQFIILCGKLGFTINLAPGPYINGQVDFGGIPFKLIETGAQVRVYGSDSFKNGYRSYLSALWIHLLENNATQYIRSVQLDDEILSQIMKESLQNAQNVTNAFKNQFIERKSKLYKALESNFRIQYNKSSHQGEQLSALQTQKYNVDFDYLTDLVNIWHKFNSSITLYVTDSSLTVLEFFGELQSEILQKFVNLGINIGLIKLDSINDIKFIQKQIQNLSLPINVFVDGIGSYECATWGDRRLGYPPNKLYKLLYILLKNGYDVNLRHFYAVTYENFAGSYRTITGTRYFMPRGSCSYFIDIEGTPIASYYKLHKIIMLALKIDNGGIQQAQKVKQRTINVLKAPLNKRITKIQEHFWTAQIQRLGIIIEYGTSYGLFEDSLMEVKSLEHYDIFKGIIIYSFDSKEFQNDTFKLQIDFSDIAIVYVGDSVVCIKIQRETQGQLTCDIAGLNNSDVIVVVAAIGRDTTGQPLMKGVSKLQKIQGNDNLSSQEIIVKPKRTTFGSFKDITLNDENIRGVKEPGFVQFNISLTLNDLNSNPYGLYFETPGLDAHFTVNDHELGFYFAVGPQSRVFCRKEYLVVGVNIVKLFTTAIENVTELNVYSSDWIYEQETMPGEVIGVVFAVILAITTFIWILSRKNIKSCKKCYH